MEPILSKQEIADLLHTLQKEDSDHPGPKTGLSAEKHTEHVEINLFKLPGGLQQEADLPNFSLIIERFRATFARALSHHLQKTVTIGDIDSHTLPFGDYLSNEGFYRATAVVDMKPLTSGCLLTLDSHLWFLLLESLLGGGSSTTSLPTDRPPTKLELSLLTSSFELACQALVQAFQPLLPITSSSIDATSEDRFRTFAASDSRISLYRFEVTLEREAGVLELVFPVEALAPYRASLEKLTAVRNPDNKPWQDHIATNLRTMPLTLSARSCLIDLSIRQLMGLTVGDVLPIPQQPDGPVEILVEGVPKFSGISGQQKNKKIIKITNNYF